MLPIPSDERRELDHDFLSFWLWRESVCWNCEPTINEALQPVGVDELARACHISVSELQMTLLELELAGRLQRLPGNRVVLLDED